jgi:hypothetical protein
LHDWQGALCYRVSFVRNQVIFIAKAEVSDTTGDAIKSKKPEQKSGRVVVLHRYDRSYQGKLVAGYVVCKKTGFKKSCRCVW